MGGEGEMAKSGFFTKLLLSPFRRFPFSPLLNPLALPPRKYFPLEGAAHSGLFPEL